MCDAAAVRALLRFRSGLGAREDGAAARAKPRGPVRIRRVLGASSGAPGHALQGYDVRYPEPDGAELRVLSPEQVNVMNVKELLAGHAQS